MKILFSISFILLSLGATRATFSYSIRGADGAEPVSKIVTELVLLRLINLFVVITQPLMSFFWLSLSNNIVIAFSFLLLLQ